jgi:hypothetical protein
MDRCETCQGVFHLRFARRSDVVLLRHVLICRDHKIRALLSSVLEQLAVSGVLSDVRRARVFERRFTGMNDESPVIGMYSDRGEDPEAERLLNDLRQVIAAAVPAENHSKYEVRFRNGLDLQEAEHADYLRKLLDSMCTAGLEAIDAARNSPALCTERDRLVEESNLHLGFAADRAHRFAMTGPSGAALSRVNEYLKGPGGQAMVVYGPSGAGKTYVVAKAASEMAQSQSAMVVRFLGTSQDSAAIAPLLRSLCEQLRAVSVGREGFITDSPSTPLGPVPADFDALCIYFREALTNWSWGPLLLLLDSVDQLDDTNAGRRLEWLLLKFSTQVFFIFLSPMIFTAAILQKIPRFVS